MLIASTDLTWLPIAGTIGGLSGLGAWVYQLTKDRQSSNEKADASRERMENVADVVLGADADWKRGRPKVIGLVERMDGAVEQIGQVDAKVDEALRLLKGNRDTRGLGGAHNQGGGT